MKWLHYILILIFIILVVIIVFATKNTEQNSQEEIENSKGVITCDEAVNLLKSGEVQEIFLGGSNLPPSKPRIQRNVFYLKNGSKLSFLASCFDIDEELEKCGEPCENVGVATS